MAFTPQVRTETLIDEFYKISREGSEKILFKKEILEKSTIEMTLNSII